LTVPEESAQTLRADGWLRTGDLATMDERGYCRIVGRPKDTIIRGGEIEEVSTDIRPSPRWRSTACPTSAGARSSGGSSGRAIPTRCRRSPKLCSHLRAHLSPQKTPTMWYAVDNYPLTGSGKIQKFAVREAWGRGEHTHHELGN
jgi:fatty-acyl-CoA synthase